VGQSKTRVVRDLSTYFEAVRLAGSTLDDLTPKEQLTVIDLTIEALNNARDVLRSGSSLDADES